MLRQTLSISLCVLGLAMGGGASAQTLGFLGAIFGDSDGSADDLRATIWVDPDGCEHWVMDDGLEGFMSQHLDRSGKPVCRGLAPTNGVCKTFDSAALFSVGSARLNRAAVQELETYFATIAGRTITVNGYTDNTGSEEANLDLSLRRAMAVVEIARRAGVIAEARGFGEQLPVADNATAAGRAKNRRVELICS